MLKKQNATAPSHGEATAAQVAALPPCAPPKAPSATPAPQAAAAPSFTPESDEPAANQEQRTRNQELASLPRSDFRSPPPARGSSSTLPTSGFPLPTSAPFRIPRWEAASTTSDFRLPTSDFNPDVRLSL